MALRGIRELCLIAVFVAALAFPAWTAPEDFAGKPIGRVQFLPARQPLSEGELARIVDLDPGQLLSLSALRTALQRLNATGRYEDIQVDAVLEDGKVILTFITQQNWFISRVSVEGADDPPNREQLVGATKLELGARYTDAQMITAIEGLKVTLRNNGFYTPRIQPLVERYPEFDELHIQFLIDPGPRAYFTRPLFTGNLKQPEDRLVATTRWQRLWGLFGWHQFTENRLQQGVERLRRSYLKRDLLLAKVDLKELDHDDDANVLRPRLDIDAGPRVMVRATGAKLSKGKIRELVPVYQEQSIDQDLLLEGQRKITEHFQAQGYFDTGVTFDRRDVSPEEQLIEYDIDRGTRYRLVLIDISGNRYFDTLTIRERMSILPASLLRNRNGRFSEALLARDRRAIEELYRSNGFRDVEVNSAVEHNYRGNARDVAVRIVIKENDQWFVNSLEISGVDLQLYSYIQSILTSTEGQPYSAFNVATDRDNILNLYYDNGFPDATMEIVSTPAAQPRRMDVKYIVTEGRRLFVQDVKVNGLEATRSDLVDSRVRLEPGDPISLSSMVFSQRRLYDLGIFAKVDVAMQNPLGNTREKRVLFNIEEGSRYSFNGGIGAEFGRFGGSQTSLASPAGGTGFAPRVSLGISRMNMFGVGHTLGVQTRLSTLQRRGLVTYLAPQFKGQENLNLTLTALYDDSRNVRTFASRRLEGSLQVGQRFNRAVSAQYRLVFRRVSLSDIKIEPGLIPLFSQPVRVGLISGTVVNDRRDDPLNATRGIYYSLDLSLANRALLSEPAFVRILARNSSYHRVSRDYVLARNTTFGWIANYGGVDIPLPERFFAGGAVSHRGFPENQAGPRDLATGFPVGGRALIFNQTEVRFPLLGNNVGGVLFHDAGNVYSDIGRISLRYRQRDLKDFDYMTHAVGLGVRYRTPIGPVRFDLGYGLNTPRFFGYKGSYTDLLNNLGEPNNQRVSRIQFHFSLGQAF